MAITLLGDIQETPFGNGQNKRSIQWGNAVFSTTDATGEIPVRMIQIESVVLTPAETPATDETLYAPELGTVTTGRFTVKSAGTVTVSRTGASPTSALNFSYMIIGIPS